MTGVVYQDMLSFYWFILHTFCRLPQLPFYLSFPCRSRDPDWISALCLGMFLKRDLEVSQRVYEKLLWAAISMGDLKSLLVTSLAFVSPALFIHFWLRNLMFSVLSWMWPVTKLSRHSPFFELFLYVSSLIKYSESTRTTCMYMGYAR